MKATAKIAQLRTQSVNRSAETSELEAVAIDSEQPIKCAKVVRG